MRVAGIQLSASDISHLAVLLQRARYTDLAHRIGRAVDANRSYLPLTSRDRKPIADALAGIGDGPLVELRRAILREHHSPVHLE